MELGPHVLVDNIMEMVSTLGVGMLLAKVDIKSAYRIIPLFQEDWSMGPNM